MLDVEVDMYKSLDAIGGVVVKDEALVGLDEKTRKKLIAQDNLKVEKVKDALEKTRLKEVEKKKKKQDDKAKEKVEKEQRRAKRRQKMGRTRRPMCRER